MDINKVNSRRITLASKFYQAYGQTDVMNDPRYLQSLMARSPRDPLRALAEERLKNIQIEQGRQTQEQELGERIKSREQIASENIAQRTDRAREVQQAHQDMLTARTEAQKDAAAARLLQAIPDIALAYPNPKEAQVVSRQILAQSLGLRGITLPGTTAATQRFAGGGATPTTTGAPTTEVAGGGAAPPAVVGAPTAPATTGGGGATPAPPGMTLDEMLKSTPPGQRLINAPGGGYAYAPAATNAPGAGRFNVGLEDVRPPGTVGMINGRPAGEVLADIAQAHPGTIPEAMSGRMELARRTGVTVAPTMTAGAEGFRGKGGGSDWGEGGGVGGWLAGQTTPEQKQAAEIPQGKFTFGDWLFGRTQPTGGAAPTPPPTGGEWTGGGATLPPPPTGGATPAPVPTPGATPAPGPFSGSFGQFSQGPEPTATPGPAAPPIPPVPGALPTATPPTAGTMNPAQQAAMEALKKKQPST